MSTEHPASVLVAVDVQYDFLPGGALGVAHGDVILEPLFELMRSGRFSLVVATQDWHPRGHVSFASTHPGAQPLSQIELYGRSQILWPDHCVQGSAGARLHDGLPREPLAAILRKGADPRVDSYSAFRNNWDEHGQRPPTGLAGYLRERGIREVWLAGLARDFCVLWSAQDAADAGFEVRVLWDLTRPVDPSSDEGVRATLGAHGVRIVEGAAGSG
jgi:nicotinamidase/pyrazinamidase